MPSHHRKGGRQFNDKGWRRGRHLTRHSPQNGYYGPASVAVRRGNPPPQNGYYGPASVVGWRGNPPPQNRYYGPASVVFQREWIGHPPPQNRYYGPASVVGWRGHPPPQNRYYGPASVVFQREWIGHPPPQNGYYGPASVAVRRGHPPPQNGYYGPASVVGWRGHPPPQNGHYGPQQSDKDGAKRFSPLPSNQASSPSRAVSSFDQPCEPQMKEEERPSANSTDESNQPAQPHPIATRRQVEEPFDPTTVPGVTENKPLEEAKLIVSQQEERMKDFQTQTAPALSLTVSPFAEAVSTSIEASSESSSNLATSSFGRPCINVSSTHAFVVDSHTDFTYDLIFRCDDSRGRDYIKFDGIGYCDNIVHRVPFDRINFGRGAMEGSSHPAWYYTGLEVTVQPNPDDADVSSLPPHVSNQLLEQPPAPAPLGDTESFVNQAEIIEEFETLNADSSSDDWNASSQASSSSNDATSSYEESNWESLLGKDNFINSVGGGRNCTRSCCEAGTNEGELS